MRQIVRIVPVLALLLFSAGLACAARTTNIVRSNARGSMSYSYHRGLGNTWSTTTTITTHNARGTMVQTFHAENGNKWSQNNTITTSSPRGTMVQTFNSGSK